MANSAGPFGVNGGWSGIGGDGFGGGDRGRVGGQFLELVEQLSDGGVREIGPDAVGRGEVMGVDLVEQVGSGGGDDDAVRAAIGGMGLATDKQSSFESINQPGRVGSMHDQQST